MAAPFKEKKWHKGFLLGASEVLDYSLLTHPRRSLFYVRYVKNPNAETEALASDWEAVGKSFRQAVEAF